MTDPAPRAARGAAATAASWPAVFMRFSATSDQLVLAAGVFWALAVNRPFFAAALRAHGGAEIRSWTLVIALAVMLASLHVLLAGLVCTRRTVKPVLALMTLVAASALHYMQAYGVVLDPSMLRNVLRTDTAEASELLTWGLALDLALYGALPIAFLAAARVESRPWRKALVMRAALLGGAALALAGSLMWQFQPIASLTRNHREVRYLITPANVLWSVGSVVAADARGAAQPRQAIGLDAAPGPGWAAQTRPRLMVVVVGETARGANWGLNGYARQTTPQLARLQAEGVLVNFSDMTACGTSTEVSLPCMFAPVGRRDYDEARIRGSESLLHVLARAGAKVTWRDNQAGCKGVCDGLPIEFVSAASAPGLCQGDRCWDEGLLRGLDERLQHAKGVAVLVLHMLGNHGPSYFRRYPSTFERFRPTCREDDLSRCTTEQIVNAYDNAILYTDHVLASLIATLDANAAKVDSALVFASDHGESLGEKGLFLHGIPFAIAPREQTHVPMVMWWSSGFGRSAGLDADCMRARALQPASHDHLFHTLLGLLDVRTALYEPAWDASGGCRKNRPAQ